MTSNPPPHASCNPCPSYTTAAAIAADFASGALHPGDLKEFAGKTMTDVLQVCRCAAAVSVVRLDCTRVASAVRCSCGIIGAVRASYSQQRITDASKDKDIANSKKALQVSAKQRVCVVCSRGVNAFDARAGVRKEAIKELEELKNWWNK